jgi:uncharacterized secreted protein with C-terminal beta-propeller domain
VPSQQSNDLYVLNADLNVRGGIIGLAPGERIYSVRFDGPVGYVVTFRETDPLFSIDLSDPARPRVMDALKIPGFSEYLHPWAAGRLFGLGMHADNNGLVSGMKLSMFDTSDPFAISEMSTQRVSGDNSDALSDHKAIFVDTRRELIGFAVWTYAQMMPLEDSVRGGNSDNDGVDSSAGESSGGSVASGDSFGSVDGSTGSGVAGDRDSWSAAEPVGSYLIYRYDEAEGFVLVAALPTEEYYSWSRGMFVGEYFYLCQSSAVDVYDPTNFKRVKLLGAAR